MQKAIRCLCVCLTVACAVLMTGIIVTGATTPDHYNVVAGGRLTLDGSLTVAPVSPAFTPANRAQPVAALDTELSTLKAGSEYTASLQLFGLFPVKTVSVHVVSETAVVPLGTPFGIKLFTDGVLVVGFSDVDTAAGAYNPAASAGMKVGDVIVSIDGTSVNTASGAASLIEQSGDRTIDCRVRRDGVEFDVRFRCAKSLTENRYKAGIWIRDSTAGIGTLTFYVPGSNIFAGLGHAVCDVDTGDILPIASGEAVPARIFSCRQGASGSPGELLGGFEPGSLGSLDINTESGVYGQMTQPVTGEAMPVAMRQQVKPGYAQILTTIEGTTPQLYDVQIEQIRYNDSSQSRNMVIVITDPRLLEITGGIVQGMSGSPLLQNGMLVGAVTHVYVNDPTKGFAIFAENMLNTANSATLQQQSTAA